MQNLFQVKTKSHNCLKEIQSFQFFFKKTSFKIAVRIGFCNSIEAIKTSKRIETNGTQNFFKF